MAPAFRGHGFLAAVEAPFGRPLMARLWRRIRANARARDGCAVARNRKNAGGPLRSDLNEPFYDARIFPVRD